jgi:hypothetical protein
MNAFLYLLLQTVLDGVLDRELTLLVDEACFQQSGYITAQTVCTGAVLIRDSF